ncbi:MULTISPECIES: SusC/RagA family TonB-linked outer membrane protein [Bacteroidales]|uniref:SusC/RagA family TonB-linked outer membrane protein n=1 Tax=Bacteroidales TaxID=171549 RepID=UPI000693DA62|nr:MULTISPECIES: TonB-dependent receptor [Bacteroidales]
MRKKSKPEKLNHKVLYLSICLLFVGTPQINAVIGKEDKSEAVVQKAEIIVTGTIKDSSGEPLVGASVAIPKSAIGTIADYNGKFTLKVPEGTKTVMVSCVGFVSQTLKLDGKNTFSITLQETTTDLDDVVVVGYSTQKKETVTGAISMISTKELVQSPQANISNSLVGRMPGLFAVQRSGEPGKDQSTLRIRGIGTFAEGEGLQDPLVMVDGIETPNFNTIDPNEIESISILKDASATAVYGVRGANGVILITTKRGEKGRPKISVTSSVAVTDFPFLRKSMNAYDFAYNRNMAAGYDFYRTGSYDLPYTDEELMKFKDHSDPIFYPDVDWFDETLKKSSLQQQSNISISGGTDRVRYFFSMGQFLQNGMFNTANYDPGYDYQLKYRRYNIRSNFDIDVTKDLLLSFDFSTQIDNNRGINWSTQGFMEWISSIPSNASPGIVDGKITTAQTTTKRGDNPFTAFDKGWHSDYSNTLNGSIRLNYKMDWLLKGLSVRGAISYKNYITDVKKYDAYGQTYDARPTTEGGYILVPLSSSTPMRFGDTVSKNRRIYLEAGASYDRSFGAHHVTALVLYNQSKYIDPNLAYLVPNGYQGIVGRITYNYDSRYLAEFNIGYNGTENFAEGHRFGVFPAYSLGWVLSEEPFFPRNDYVSFIKIRGTYGEVGNDKIGGDRFLYRPTSYTYVNDVYHFGEFGISEKTYNGAIEGKLGNPDLTWERARKMNIGADLKFYKDKIGLTFDFFREKRDNILCNRGTVPDITGANMPAYNLGKMTNGGFEGELSYMDTFGDFKLGIRGNFSYAHNTIDYMDEVYQKYSYRYSTGRRYGQFFGLIAEGLYNTWEEVNDINRPVYTFTTNKIQPGDVKYRDVNGDGKIDWDDQVPIGYSTFPEITYGFSLTGEYKGFDFSVLFQGAAHVSNMPSRRTQTGFYNNTGAGEHLLESWSQERYEQGLKIRYPHVSTYNDHNYYTSTFWLEDASYLRLKNVEIGYTFRNKFFDRIGVSSLRLYANGSNLLTWCDMLPGEDPEVANLGANNEPYPLTRVFNFGVNINF